MKLNIRFLKQGLVEAEAPPNFDNMSPEEKLDWAQTVLAEQSDDQLHTAMADYLDPKVNGYFDEAPDVCSIQDTDGEELVLCASWYHFWAPQQIVKPPIMPP